MQSLTVLLGFFDEDINTSSDFDGGGVAVGETICTRSIDGLEAAYRTPTLTKRSEYNPQAH
jgi:hypothetical protein